MEEDEEIDILGGDFDGLVSKTEREISNISAGQILSCDYTVHPRWLTDNLDSTDFAIDDNNIAQEICIGDDDDTPIYSSEDDDYEKSVDQSIENDEHESADETNWNSEMANNTDIILEEAIPAAVEEEVVTNFYHVSPCEPPPQLVNRSILKIKPNQVPIENPPPNPRSILKINLPPYKFKQTLKVDRDTFEKNKKILKKNLRNIAPKIRKGSTSDKVAAKKTKGKPKFKQSVKIKVDKSDNLFKNKLIKSKKTAKVLSARKKRSGVIFDENITINHTDDPSSHSEMHVKIENIPVPSMRAQNDDSDIEIDIESGEPDLLEFQVNIASDQPDPAENITRLMMESTKLESVDHQKKTEIKIKKTEIYDRVLLNDPFLMNVMANCSDAVRIQLESMEEPAEALVLNLNEITELERIVHAEFFEGRPTKTPDRYMKIRAHIINSWQMSRPNYVSKTAVRAGLKNCGDVNCISRIHSLLEQIGAINFGCQNDYFGYIRPLKSLISVFNQPARQHKGSAGFNAVNSSIEFERRQRAIKTLPPASDANFTISHSGGAERVSIGLEKREPKIKRNYELELIKCQQFNQHNFAPFKVSMTLSTLLCLYLHSLSSKYEIMGFLGGYRTKSVGRNKLSIARYKPCVTLKQSGTMCEMCPISQIEQSTILLSEGYDLLGWFHTHPLFPPNPSRTDVRTQMEMQIQFSTNNDLPFVGVILGCLDMTCRCIYVLPNELSQWENVIPYEINVDIIKDCTNFENDVTDVLDIIKNDPENYQSILDKFISAADNLLQKYGYDLSLLNFLNNVL